MADLHADLGAFRPPPPWPATVQATREHLFRPRLTPLPHVEVQHDAKDRDRRLGGLNGLSRRLCLAAERSRLASDAAVSMPAAHVVELGIETLLPSSGTHPPAADAFADEVNALLRAPSGMADGDGILAAPDTAKALAPLGSARQRSERAQRLLSTVMAPLDACKPLRTTASIPRCLHRTSNMSVLSDLPELEYRLHLEHTSPSAADVLCRTNCYLEPRAPTAPAKAHPRTI